MTAIASILRTNNYAAAGAIVRNAYADTFPSMVVAINIGIIQPVQDLTAVLSHCDSGNCTFPADNGAFFSTVAVSHSCKNITSEVQEIQVVNETGKIVSWSMSSYAATPSSSFLS
jgi:hypothetical protein